MRILEGTIEAKLRPAICNVFKTLAQTAVMWGFFLAVLPMAIAYLERTIVGWELPAIPAEICWAGFALFGSIFWASATATYRAR